jgi:hypothetical protein
MIGGSPQPAIAAAKHNEDQRMFMRADKADRVPHRLERLFRGLAIVL